MTSGIVETFNGMPVHYIDAQDALEAAAAGWLRREVVALDTEFMRVRTFHAQAALFQVCDGETCFLVDPLAVGDLAPLARLLDARDVLKVMHSCSEDLEVCDRHLGTLPDPLVDTQIVAAFCGYPLSVGYQKMLAAEFDVHLGKSETRTDWLQRPLSPAQIHYAAEDVAFLPALWRVLAQRLAGKPADAWAREECAATLARFRARNGADWRTIGGAWRLDPRALAVLRALHAWREETVRTRDLPRSWLLPDAVLLRLAELRPQREEQLGAVEELPDGVRRRYGRAIVEQVAAALALDAAQLPPALPPPLDTAQGRRLKALRAHAITRGETLGVAPEMLARRRDFEELLRWCDGPEGAEPPAVLGGWRLGVIGEELLALARKGTA
jgi:ribonuclease D